MSEPITVNLSKPMEASHAQRLLDSFLDVYSTFYRSSQDKRALISDSYSFKGEVLRFNYNEAGQVVSLTLNDFPKSNLQRFAENTLKTKTEIAEFASYFRGTELDFSQNLPITQEQVNALYSQIYD